MRWSFAATKGIAQWIQHMEYAERAEDDMTRATSAARPEVGPQAEPRAASPSPSPLAATSAPVDVINRQNTNTAPLRFCLSLHRTLSSHPERSKQNFCHAPFIG